MIFQLSPPVEVEAQAITITSNQFSRKESVFTGGTAGESPVPGSQETENNHRLAAALMADQPGHAGRSSGKTIPPAIKKDRVRGRSPDEKPDRQTEIEVWTAERQSAGGHFGKDGQGRMEHRGEQPLVSAVRG